MPADLSPIRRQPRLGQAHGNVRPALTIAPLPTSPPQHGIAGKATKGYDAARQDRLTSDWNVSRLSADAELQGKLPIIRDRFREHSRNEPLAKNFLTLIENNVVGDQGFAFESKVVKSRSIDAETGEEVIEYDAEVCRAVERVWKQFGHRDTFLTTRNMDMTAAWKLIARTVWGDGDCLLRLVRGYPNKYGFAVQLLEPDFLDDQFIEFRGVPCNCPDELTLPDGRPFPRCERGLHQVRMGVELHGDWMFPLAYWILADHPGDYFFGNQYNTRRTRVPVADMIHPFVFKRMGQTRGVSEMEAAMLRMQMLGGMDEATLVKARAAAQKIGIIEKDIPDSIVDQFADQYDQNVPTMDCEPGGMLEFPPGFHFKPWDPQDPSPQYDPFTERQERMIAIGSGVAATSLTGNLKNVNYSSIRTGVLEEREGWKGRQRFFVSEVVRRIFEAFIPMAILSRQLDVSMSLVDEIIDQEAACFQGRRWPWVDPEKDVAAEKAAVDAGFKTISDVTSEQNRDFEKVTAGLGREKRMRAKEGLLPPEETTAAAMQPGNGADDADAATKAHTLAEILSGEALKRDGWVTINGRPVHFGVDGKVDSGSGGLLATAKQTARSAFADKAGEDAFAAGNAAHTAPSPETHVAAAGAHRAAAAAHADAAQAGPRSTEHAGHAEMHTEKAGQHDQLAVNSKPAAKPAVGVEVLADPSVLSKRGTATIGRAAAMLKERGFHLGDSHFDGKQTHYLVTHPDGTSQPRTARDIQKFLRTDAPSFPPVTTPKRQARSFQLPFAPAGAADVLDHIADEGGMVSRKAAEKRGHFQNGGSSDYDDAPELKGVYHHAVFGGSMKPDRMAAILHENHGVGDGSVGGLYSEIDKAVTTRKAVQQETKRQEVEHQQGQRFEREAMKPRQGEKAVHVGNLAVGDTLTIHGEKVKVKGIDPDTMDVTLQDHTRYGAQKVQDGQVLYVEQIEHAAGSSPAHEEDSSTMWKPESLDGDPSPRPDQSTALTHSNGPAKGASIARLHRIEPNLDPQQRAVVSRAHAAVDQAHGIVGAGQITATPIRSNPSLRGAKAAYRMRGPFGHVEIVPGHSNELDVIHEMAHALDHQALGTNGGGLASLDKTKLRGIKAAIERSPQVKTLNRMARNAKGGQDRVSQHLVEAAKPYEKFARAYEQYVASTSADPKLLGQLAEQRADRYFGAQKYWSDEAFAPILKAFDKHFASEGWK